MKNVAFDNNSQVSTVDSSSQQGDNQYSSGTLLTPILSAVWGNSAHCHNAKSSSSAAHDNFGATTAVPLSAQQRKHQQEERDNNGDLISRLQSIRSLVSKIQGNGAQSRHSLASLEEELRRLTLAIDTALVLKQTEIDRLTSHVKYYHDQYEEERLKSLFGGGSVGRGRVAGSSPISGGNHHHQHSYPRDASSHVHARVTRESSGFSTAPSCGAQPFSGTASGEHQLHHRSPSASPTLKAMSLPSASAAFVSAPAPPPAQAVFASRLLQRFVAFEHKKQQHMAAACAHAQPFSDRDTCRVVNRFGGLVSHSSRPNTGSALARAVPPPIRATDASSLEGTEAGGGASMDACYAEILAAQQGINHRKTQGSLQPYRHGSAHMTSSSFPTHLCVQATIYNILEYTTVRTRARVGVLWLPLQETDEVLAAYVVSHHLHESSDGRGGDHSPHHHRRCHL